MYQALIGCSPIPSVFLKTTHRVHLFSSILQMSKLRLREVRRLPRLLAWSWSRSYLNPSWPVLKPAVASCPLSAAVKPMIAVGLKQVRGE